MGDDEGWKVETTRKGIGVDSMEEIRVSRDQVFKMLDDVMDSGMLAVTGSVEKVAKFLISVDLYDTTTCMFLEHGHAIAAVPKTPKLVRYIKRKHPRLVKDLASAEVLYVNKMLLLERGGDSVAMKVAECETK